MKRFSFLLAALLAFPAAAGPYVSSGTPNPHPAYVAGNFYVPFAGTGTVAGTPAANVLNTVKCFYGVVWSPVTISQLNAKVSTNVSSQHFQLAVYRTGPWGRPGALIDNTADISTASTGNIAANLGANQSLAPGGYWWCANTDTSTLILVSFANTTVNGGPNMLGSTSADAVIGGSALVTGVSVAQTYGTWPNFVSGTAWADITNNSTPIIAAKVASVP